MISEWVSRPWPRILNIGAAEGFYAVGLARAIPTAKVIAYDLDDDSRARCHALAVANGVGERILIEEECTPAGLEALPAQDTAVLCDCEGCEKYLLDPALAPMLGACEILVEMHDFLDASIAEIIRERFQATHVITVIDGRSRADIVPPELEELPQSERLVLIGERRPAAMQWARLEPHQNRSA